MFFWLSMTTALLAAAPISMPRKYPLTGLSP
jgi:hypothetical protein